MHGPLNITAMLINIDYDLPLILNSVYRLHKALSSHSLTTKIREKLSHWQSTIFLR